MVGEQKGVTVGAAALIIAIVAAGIIGGLCLFTHYGSSEGRNRRDRVKDEFIQSLKPENTGVYALGHLDVRTDTVKVLSTELADPENSEYSELISDENMPDRVWVIKLSALTRKTNLGPGRSNPWTERQITCVVNARTGFLHGVLSNPQIKVVRFGPLTFDPAWTPVGSGPRYGLVEGEVSVKNTGDSPLHISGMNVTISGEKVSGVPYWPGPGALENSRTAVVPPGDRKTITMHFEIYLKRGEVCKIRSFKPGTYTTRFKLFERREGGSEVIASGSKEITIGEPESPVGGLNLKLFRKGGGNLNVGETVKFLAVLENTGSLSKHVNWGSPPSIRVYDRRGRLVGKYPSVIAPNLITPVGSIGRYLYSFSLKFVRGGKYRVEVSYGIHGENIDELGSIEDSVWITVQGPTPSLKEIENLLPDYHVKIGREGERSTVIIGLLPKMAAEKKEIRRRMHSFDRWTENGKWGDKLSDYGVYMCGPKEEKGYYKVGMNPLSPKLIAKAFREFREASLSADVGAFGKNIPIAFSGNPEAPAIFHKISENRIETDRWARAVENHIRNLYPPDDVGYEITSKSENRVKGFIYLKGENDQVPFENIELKLENGHWNLYPGPWDTTVRSPSKNLEITGYSIDKCSVGSSEWSGEHRCLDKIRPTVKNGSGYPAFVSSVHMRIENLTDTFTKSYPAGVIFIGRISIGIIPSGRTVEVGYRGGPALIPKWSSGGSKSFLRMDELAGENFHITLTLKDGEGTTLAKRTFHKTFENPPVSNLVEENRFVSSNLEREKNPDVSQNQMSELVDGNTQFAFDLYQQIRDKKGNLFYSPYSISTALSMTYAGARGETAQQMGDTLHFTLAREQLHPSFYALSQSLDDRENFTLKLANALWGQENWRFKEDFLDTLALNYGAGMHRLDFWSNPEQARRIVNEWVENHTKNKIENLVPPGAFKGLPAVLVLTNAIYFKAPWEHSFPEDQTRERAFTFPNGENVKVPMMSSGPRPLLCTEGKNYKAVKIPYLGNGSMTIILPDEGHFREVERP